MAQAPPPVLISGGSRGLGQALVECLLEARHPVATFSRAASPFVEAQRAKDPDGRQFHWAAVDLVSPKDLASFVAEAERRFGPIGILINNAAITEEAVLPL